MTRSQERLRIESADNLSAAAGSGPAAPLNSGNPVPSSRLRSIASAGMRLLRYAALERSYERYYSPEEWEKTYRDGYRLDGTEQDGRYGALLAVINRYDRGGPILDAGCGDGILERRYRELSGTRMVGIDFSERAIEQAQARRLPDCEFHCADYRRFMSEEKFTAVVFNESLYYVEDFLGAVDALGRYLSAGGVTIISMFETVVTRRIWNALATRHKRLQGVAVCDEATRRLWRVRVLQPLG